MVSENTKLQVIKNMAIRGMVLHTEIKPHLNKIECGVINPDEIIKLSLKYKYGKSKTLGSKLKNKTLVLFDRIITIVLALISGVVFAEIKTAKIFADTIIGDRLNGFGDNLLFWLGKKSIEVTGIEMINAMSEAFKSTPQILKWFFIGVLSGFIIWKSISGFFLFIYKRKRLNYDIKKILRIYALHTSAATTGKG